MLCLKGKIIELPKKLTVHNNISRSMKIILKKIDPIKYSYLTIDEIKTHKIVKQNTRNSPW